MESPKMFRSFIILKIAIVGLVSCQDKNVIKLENGAYSNVLIAINKNVKENATIIDNLKVTKRFLLTVHEENFIFNMPKSQICTT